MRRHEQAITDDDARAIEPDAPAATPDDPAPAPAAAPAGRAWLRRLGVGLVIVVAAIPVGLQFQVSSERAIATRSEEVQRKAERDERQAQNRLSTVNTRMVVARTQEADAQGVLDRARADMTAQGLEEASLDAVHDQIESHVKDLRSQSSTVAATVAEQKRLQPAAENCLFDLLRTLGRGRSGHHEAPPSDACAVVAARAPGQT